MWKPDICIYHGNCDDGFAAATIARMKWPDLPCYGAVHNKPLLIELGAKNVLMVDFSLKRDVMTKVFGEFGWKSCIVLDHHKTAEAELQPFIADWLSLPDMHADTIGNLDGTFAKFDMKKSGAMLAWEFCFPYDQAPLLVEMVQARDLWRLSQEVEYCSAALRSYPQDFEIWTRLMKSDAATQRMIVEGEGIHRSHLMTMAKILREKHLIKIGQDIVHAVNCPYHYASDAAHVILEQDAGAPFGAAYFRRADGRWQFSLRSDDGRVDVSEVAKRFGGGGHRNAAGFDVEDLEDLVLPVGGVAR